MPTEWWSLGAAGRVKAKGLRHNMLFLIRPMLVKQDSCNQLQREY